MKPENELRVALHECGHALIARHFGFRITTAAVTEWGGHITVPPPPAGFHTRALAGVLLAGYTAEVVFFGQSIRPRNEQADFIGKTAGYNF